MKKIVAILLAVVLCVGLAACGASSAAPETKKIVMGTSADYPPFEFIVLNDKNEQQFVGIDISVANELAKGLGAELQISNMDFDSLMAALQKGDVDIVLAAIEATPERLEAADFSDPYYNPSGDDAAMVLVKKDNADLYSSKEDFAGKSVGAQTGTTKAELVSSDFTGANLVALTSVLDLVNQLSYDKVDAIVLDGAVALQYAQANEDLVVANVDLGAALPYCVAVQKGDPKGLLESINATIAQLQKDNAIEAFYAEADALSDQAIE
ncbi:MAG: transporter substrate-binding domain-containing protein [Oscillospiraceae bacterium]|nr:transporter substrate-binding domain-containing protein [Oscillospiraceae bacterium]